MKVYLQWTLADPTDWVEIDVSARNNEWALLPHKSEPTDAALDNEPGWVFDVCVQGLHFFGADHYAVEPIGLGGVRVYSWYTDITDPDPQAYTYRWGSVWDLFPPGPDPKLNGAINTRQRKTIYTEVVEPLFQDQQTSLGPVQVRDWTQWPAPDESLVRHGIWVRDEQLLKQHREVRATHGWREWV